MDRAIFNVQKKCLHTIGLHRNNLIKHPRLFKVYHVALVSCWLSSLLAEANFVLKNYEAVLESSEAFVPISTILIGLSMFCVFLWYREEFYELIDQITQLADEVDGENIIKIQKVNRIYKIVNLAFLSSALTAGFIQNIIPLLNNFNNFWQGNPMAWDLPWRAAYPYDTQAFPGYEFSYFTLVATTFTIICSIVSTKSF